MNLPKQTERLFDSIYGNGFADVKVLENGSTVKKRTGIDGIQVKENKYFGGALNIIFSEFKSNKEYDSLIILNNDLIVPDNFVENMQKTFYKNNMGLLSPCIFNMSEEQPYWRMMRNWGSKKIREVKWVDFVAVMFSRGFVEEIDQFDNQLIYGKGQSIYTGIIAEQKGYKIGIADWISVLHINQLTQKEYKETGGLPVHLFNERANENMNKFFERKGLSSEFNEMRKYARNYKI